MVTPHAVALRTKTWRRLRRRRHCHRQKAPQPDARWLRCLLRRLCDRLGSFVSFASPAYSGVAGAWTGCGLSGKAVVDLRSTQPETCTLAIDLPHGPSNSLSFILAFGNQLLCGQISGCVLQDPQSRPKVRSSFTNPSICVGRRYERHKRPRSVTRKHGGRRCKHRIGLGCLCLGQWHRLRRRR